MLESTIKFQLERLKQGSLDGPLAQLYAERCLYLQGTTSKKCCKISLVFKQFKVFDPRTAMDG